MVNTEAGVRETIDTQLATNIQNEYSRATGAEAKMNGDLAAEAKARADYDANLTTLI
jgi:hypothetical protein